MVTDISRVSLGEVSLELITVIVTYKCTVLSMLFWNSILVPGMRPWQPLLLTVRKERSKVEGTGRRQEAAGRWNSLEKPRVPKHSAIPQPGRALPEAAWDIPGQKRGQQRGKWELKSSCIPHSNQEL